MGSPDHLIRKRKRERVFSLIGKRKREIMESSDPLFLGTIQKLDGVKCKRFRELIIEADNRHVVAFGETKGEVESPNSDAEENAVGDGRRDVEVSKSVVVVERKGDKDGPPVDDCCPICFGDFSIACKTNCGHWFCANCILQFWNYRASIQKCKCPICSQLISKLTPEASLLVLQDGEVVEVLKNVQRYNSLFQGGVHGFRLKMLEFPLFLKRMLRGLMDPDRVRANYYTIRLFALLLSCIYDVSPLDFIPVGGPLGARRLFDVCAVAIVVILYLVGVCHRLLLRRRVRQLAAAPT